MRSRSIAKTQASETSESALQWCMDYLHGDDIAPDELQAACCYEYARKSNVLRKAASLRKKLERGDADIVAVSELVEREFNCSSLVDTARETLPMLALD